MPLSIGSILDAIIAADHKDLAIEWPDTGVELRAAAAEFQRRSENNVFTECVGAIDGMLVRTTQPNDFDNPRSYYSDHYECFGVNLEAACDAKLRFIYIGLG